MGNLHMKAMDRKYNEYVRRLKVQFLNGLDDENMVEEMIRELTTLKDNSKVSSEWILLWAQEWRNRGCKMNCWTTSKNQKSLTGLEYTGKKHYNNGQWKGDGNKKGIIENWKYCGTGHLQRKCAAYGKMCNGYGKANHFKVVCKTMQR